MATIFYIIAAISVISALFVVSAKNPVNSVIALIVCFLSIAGHYILLNAQFLAMVHIIVYTGAIVDVPLRDHAAEPEPGERTNEEPWARAWRPCLGGTLFLTLVAAIRNGVGISVQTTSSPASDWCAVWACPSSMSSCFLSK